jgi:hypothetical protein
MRVCDGMSACGCTLFAEELGSFGGIGHLLSGVRVITAYHEAAEDEGELRLHKVGRLLPPTHGWD